MTDASHSPFSDPKRKRTDFMTDDSPSPLSASFSFDVNGPASVPASGSSSPRTKVAHRFRGLALTDHGPASGPAVHAHASGLARGGVAFAAAIAHAHCDNDTAKPAQLSDRRLQIDENEAIMRKRTRLSPDPDPAAAPLRTTEAAQSHAQGLETTHAPESQPPFQFAPVPNDQSPRQGGIGQLVLDQAIFSSSPKPSPSKILTHAPSAPRNRTVEGAKSRVRKRASTPPLVGIKSISASSADPTAEVAAEIIDPIRAALTWHEDEITVYDPEDEDDDGVGINGIGFKPTPAIAYARTVKRRQQLSEYKKREEREARARRTLRRRGSPERTVPTTERKTNAARKVRFTETEPSMMIETI